MSGIGRYDAASSYYRQGERYAPGSEEGSRFPTPAPVAPRPYRPVVRPSGADEALDTVGKVAKSALPGAASIFTIAKNFLGPLSKAPALARGAAFAANWGKALMGGIGASVGITAAVSLVTNAWDVFTGEQTWKQAFTNVAKDTGMGAMSAAVGGLTLLGLAGLGVTGGWAVVAAGVVAAGAHWLFQKMIED